MYPRGKCTDPECPAQDDGTCVWFPEDDGAAPRTPGAPPPPAYSLVTFGGLRGSNITLAKSVDGWVPSLPHCLSLRFHGAHCTVFSAFRRVSKALSACRLHLSLTKLPSQAAEL